MPLYLLTVEEGRSTESQRKHIAEDITTIHVDVTGAPPEFVNAYFSEGADASGGYEELPEGKVVLMTGNIRAGRTGEAKSELVDRLAQGIAETLACSAEEIDINLVEAKAAHGMEGGKILPEPGSAEEQAWRERGHAKHVKSTVLTINSNRMRDKLMTTENSTAGEGNRVVGPHVSRLRQI